MISKKIPLVILPTPLESISFDGKSFLIKRDDLTGCELSGNKSRKLEYIMAEAKNQKADIILTCGGEQSNHARATTIAAQKSGIQARLFLWGSDQIKANGNLFLNKMYGADISFLSKREYDRVNDIMFEECENYAEDNIRAYVVPEGGSTTLGIMGYVDFINELKKQVDLKKIDGIVAASGTGGTAAGMLLGAAMNKLDLKIYAVNVLYRPEILVNKILFLAEACIAENKFKCKVDRKNLVILDGYSKEGYKRITRKKIALIKKFARESGILLDPAYSGKAFVAYYEHFLKKNIGLKNIFVHTGGLFGAFSRTKDYLN